MSLRIEQARFHHAKMVAQHMRARDLEEVQAGWGNPENAIASAIDGSPAFARTAFWELEPVAIFGMRALTVLGKKAEVWCFGTAAIAKHRIAFLRASRSQLQEMFRHAEVLTNYVDATDYDALRWLGWLGARSALPPITLNGRLFAQFFLTAREVGESTCQLA